MSKKTFADREIYKVLINAPIETVWSELIKTTSPRPFFWNSSWDAKVMAPGNAYRMVSNGGKTVAVIGEILEMDPPHRLVHSFRLTSLEDPPSTVTYTLKETEGGTEFCLITENIVAGSKSEKSMADGARFIVKNFKAYLETGKVTFGARMMLGMFKLMAPMTPKSMSAENWPRDR
ncbi:MAG TPA: SRPBCC domain-containing protein [Woeseiaceae bacterium]|nr:SRPBCC domain-containing protein [Woeseiaceae bacterium]